MDLPIIINKDCLTPLHKQLTDAVRDAIVSSRLSPRQALPSSRELAVTLAISRRTVVRSYNDLISQGYLETTFGGRTFVSGSPPVDSTAVQAAPDPERQPVDECLVSNFARQLLRQDQEIVDFSHFSPFNYCGPPSDMVPIKQWRQILSKHCNDPLQMDYVLDIFGYRPLREEICKYLRRSKALQCDAEQLIASVDTQTSLDLVGRALINPGDVVVVENPGYFYARELFIAYGADIRPMPIDESGLVVSNLNNIKEHCKLILVTPSHQDPLGSVMTLERRRFFVGVGEGQLRLHRRRRLRQRLFVLVSAAAGFARIGQDRSGSLPL